MAERNGISLNLFKKHAKLILNIDKGRIEEVIDNLLSNALKFTPAGGSIEISVDIQKSGYTENAIITIRDTGTGISAEKLIHIFDRFYQADDSSTKQFEGSGLGLSIVKDFVELHGGSINVESKLNAGTTFTIYLPYEEIEITENTEELKAKESIIGEEKSLISNCRRQFGYAGLY